jgi:hypothetical protein
VFIILPGLNESGNVATTSGINWFYEVTVTDSTTMTVTGNGNFTGSYTGNSGNSYLFACPTLDAGARGAKPIYNNLVITPSPGAISGGTPITANMLQTLTFSDIVDGWVGDDAGHLPGPHPSILAALGTKLGMDIWLCLGVQTRNADAALIAAAVYDNLHSSLNCYFEFANENWNFQFGQAFYLIQHGYRWGFSTSSGASLFNFWGYRFCELSKSIKALGHSNLKMSLAFQGAGDTTVDTNLFKTPLLKSTSTAYWAYNPIDYSVAGDGITTGRAVDFADVLSYGMYVYGATVLQFDAEYTTSIFHPDKDAAFFAGLTAAADAYDGGDTSQVSFVDNDIRYGTYPPFAVTIAADGTFTCSSGTCASNSISANLHVQIFVIGGSLPSPLQDGTTNIYYARDIGASTFKVSATKGGAAITSLTGGSGSFSVGISANSIIFWNSDRLNFWNDYAVTYDKPVIIYEAAASPWYPSTSRCTTLGIDTAYSQKILNLVQGWCNADLARLNTIDLMEGFMAASKSLYAGQLQVIGCNPWSMLNGFNNPPTSGSASTFLGDIYQTPNKRYDGFKEFNNT